MEGTKVAKSFTSSSIEPSVTRTSPSVTRTSPSVTGTEPSITGTAAATATASATTGDSTNGSGACVIKENATDKTQLDTGYTQQETIVEEAQINDKWESTKAENSTKILPIPMSLADSKKTTEHPNQISPGSDVNLKVPSRKVEHAHPITARVVVRKAAVEIGGLQHEIAVHIPLFQPEAAPTVRFCVLRWKKPEIECSMRSDVEILDGISSKDMGLSGNPQNKTWRKIGKQDFPVAELLYAERKGTTMTLHFLKRRKHNKWTLRPIKMDFKTKQSKFTETESSLICAEWEKFFEETLAELTCRPSSLLVFVNPFGGKRRAGKIFKEVKPILEKAKIKLTVIETERANHARDTIQSMPQKDYEKFHGIVSVGGDGLFNEILHGILMKEQIRREKGMESITESLARPQMRLGLIPAGSTNALAHTVFGNGDPVTAGLHIAFGGESGVDVCGIYQDRKLIRFACVVASFGFLGDSMKDSETKRYLGPPRYTVAGVKTLMKHNSYFGKIEFRPVFDVNRPNLEQMNALFRSSLNATCHMECSVCSAEVEITKSETNLSQGQHSSLPSGFYTNHIIDRFSHVVGSVTPGFSLMSPGGVSPSLHIGDGTMDLGIVGQISRCQNAKFVIDVMGKGADHVKHDFIQIFRVSRFSYTPGESLDLRNEDKASSTQQVYIGSKKSESKEAKQVEKSKKGSKKGSRGYWNLDGELFEQPKDTLHFRVHRQLIKLFARGVEKGGQKSEKKCCAKKKGSPAVDNYNDEEILDSVYERF